MFAPAHAEYLQAHKEEMVRRYGFVEDVSPRGHAHNLFLGLLSELGLVGFASLTLVFGVIFFSRGAERGSEAQGVRILFAFFLFHGMLEYMLHQTVYGDLFFASTGIFLGSLWRGRQEKAAAKSS
jgi:O-antigen ligase